MPSPASGSSSNPHPTLSTSYLKLCKAAKRPQTPSPPPSHLLHPHREPQEMSSAAFARIARARLFQSHALRAAHPLRSARLAQPVASFSSSCRRWNDAHHEESFEQFTARYDRSRTGGGEVQWLEEQCIHGLCKSAEPIDNTYLQITSTEVQS